VLEASLCEPFQAWLHVCFVFDFRDFGNLAFPESKVLKKIVMHHCGADLERMARAVRTMRFSRLTALHVF
jgi:hypothetical protein